MSRSASLVGASPRFIELESPPRRVTGSRAEPIGKFPPKNLDSMKSQPKDAIDQFAETHHERWRMAWEKWALQEGREISRKKPISDGTMFDINVPFDQLHPERQKLSREAAKVAMEALEAYPLTFPWNYEMAADYIHISWIRRSKLQYDDDRFVVPFTNLPEYVKKNNLESVSLMKFIDGLNKPIVKAVAQQFHETWREEYQKSNPGQKRIKVNESDGTEVDINVPFDSLHPDWQRENLFAAFAAKEICKLFSEEYNVAAAEYLHEQWMLRNQETDENKLWRKPFAELDHVDQEKYLTQINMMREQLAFKDPAIIDVASELHEGWRKTWMESNPGKPRMKVNMDGSYLDINKPFKDLHFDWQRENLLAAFAAKQACLLNPRDDEAAADYIHKEWMKRNPKTDTNAAQHVPFASLSDADKEKDRKHVLIMREAMKSMPDTFRDEKPEIGPHKIRDSELFAIRDLLQSIPDKSTTDELFKTRVKAAENYLKSPDPFENVSHFLFHCSSYSFGINLFVLLLVLESYDAPALCRESGSSQFRFYLTGKRRRSQHAIFSKLYIYLIYCEIILFLINDVYVFFISSGRIFATHMGCIPRAYRYRATPGSAVSLLIERRRCQRFGSRRSGILFYSIDHSYHRIIIILCWVVSSFR